MGKNFGTIGALGLAFGLMIVDVASAAHGPIKAVGIESQYANIISQIGGHDVVVTAIETDPNTDPHEFEASPRIARHLADAALIVENGLGYDGWADKIAAGSSGRGRTIINVQHLLGLPDSTPNPHLWYAPRTMPAVAAAIARDLSTIDPAEAGYFAANLRRFNASMKPWLAAIAAFKSRFAGTRVAVSEPVGNDLLEALGLDIATPFNLQAAIMNGTDPAPQDVATQNALLKNATVKIFVYNRQVTDPLTRSFLDIAGRSRIPVVGVYETMPVPGYDYQSWMIAETTALQRALTEKRSTRSLVGKAP